MGTGSWGPGSWVQGHGYRVMGLHPLAPLSGVDLHVLEKVMAIFHYEYGHRLLSNLLIACRSFGGGRADWSARPRMSERGVARNSKTFNDGIDVRRFRVERSRTVN